MTEVVDLPDNVWEMILRLLDGVSLINLSLASAYYSSLIEECVDWKDKFQSIPGRFVEAVTHVSADVPLKGRDPNFYKKFCFHFSALCNIDSLGRSYNQSFFKLNFPTISATIICCGFLIVGCIDGSVGIFEPKSLHKVKWVARLHSGPITALHCYCRSIFRKFPSTLISAGKDACLKFTRYDKTYLQVDDPWALPLSSEITASTKDGRRILIGQENGDVRLLTIRLDPSELDEGKQKCTASVSALYTDTRRRSVNAVALSNATVAVQVKDSTLLVLHVDFKDVPPRLVLVHSFSNFFLHPSLYLELDFINGSEVDALSIQEVLDRAIGGVKRVVAFGPIFICLDVSNKLFMMTVQNLKDFVLGQKKLDKRMLEIESAVYLDFKSMCFGYTTGGFVLILTEMNDGNKVHTSIFQKS
ncbi:uncharacterized protein LOC134842458 isoform X2 [Symsagittifera roscoffensis]|uniref:uncharacterized protein LOC134842458 isoform X2 n=1 Tax=Symsagittifera roscoffensis TaxID=84072 RepID=UPI00307C8F6C